MKIEWEVLKVSTMGASDEEKEETLWEDSDEEFPPGDIVNVKVTLEKINHNVSYRPVFQKTTRQ